MSDFLRESLGMIFTTTLRGLLRLVFGPTPEPPSLSEAAALVLVADGIGGLDLCGSGMEVMAAREARGHRVEVVRWCHGFGRWHKDLTNTANVNLWADRLAEKIRVFRELRPKAPVYLVGKSGGSGVVLRTLERLPAGTVQGAVLLAPAVSHGYDLRRALAALDGDLTVFWSPYDLILLGAGTLLFGTIDRVHTVSAGLTGFRMPITSRNPNRMADVRLRQVRWRWQMASTGYLGGHVGCDSPFFLKKYVFPLLSIRAPEEMLCNSV